jgi:hypothetical protein
MGLSMIRGMFGDEIMRSLQDGEAFFGMASTGFTRGYYQPAPPGQGACGSRRHKRDMGRPPDFGAAWD